MRHLALVACLALSFPLAARAQAPLVNGFGGVAGYGTSCLGPSDDGSSASIDLSTYFPGGLQFFDRLHTSVFVNVNGNVTFSAPQACYTPTPFPVADQPMIAPYWGDVDIRPEIPPFLIFPRDCDGPEGTTTCVPMTVATCHDPGSNGVWYHLEAGRMVVTWDRVGYYRCHPDRVMSFQLILSAAPSCGGAGDFDVEFRYNRCEWTTGDASGGMGGFGGTPAQAGFDAGNLTDFVEIMGSRTGTIHTTLCTMSNVGEPGVWRFQIRSGTVICPDAGDPCDTGGVGVCAAGRTNCVGGGTECRQDVAMSPERCDALDNDCDGSTDEDMDLCGALRVCDRGVCIDGCFEGGCPAGQSCNAAGYCIDPACATVTCGAGERCVAGECVGACDGVVCPPGQSCRGGHCIDACDGVTCETCTVCEDGLCVTSCEFAPCPPGETCLPDGHCVESACAMVTCAAGETCAAGACVPACTGVTCPMGERCEMGACVADTVPDAGPPPPADSGTGPPDSGGRTDSGGATDAGMLDGSTETDTGLRGPMSPGCACRAGAQHSGATAFGATFALALLAAIGRRRSRRVSQGRTR